MFVLELGKIKMGMLVCFKSSGGYVDKKIVRYQRRIGFKSPACDYTHVGISAGGQYLVSATWPRSKVQNLLVDYQGRIINFLDCKEFEHNEGLRSMVAFWASSKGNLPYGLMGLFGFLLREKFPCFGSNPLASRKAPFCSMLAVWAFRRVGIDPVKGTATSFITPAHLADSQAFNPVECYKIPWRPFLKKRRFARRG